MKIKAGLCLLLSMLSFSCWASERSEQAWALVEQGALLIDVRTPGEFSQGHLTDAANLPLSTVETAFANIDKDTPIVVYCRSGARSGRAMSYLQQEGYTQVHNGGGLEEMLSTKP
ncbi:MULTISPECIES: rhodanese-like domain-containing protein [Aliivibrio]|uniref:Rhodanese-like domain-containing protein n=1 Tax=Aliivibrio finisterrensis TaxID=511998 RepID=A0A4Q5KYB0_9GAMM|nr:MULTISPECIES: rhodanese-like domain-containing protein [Aliivibrio]MDD9180270.1 rhodanese-like domain-containing protein [Aliivibrio sp. A6]RYU54869.1 rhodanese-like domain-containing protein [Aliivibrio finisterrensis]RYU56545.1 rhodanese-like domain-containing protein [Aliivibrio finisterrensis]RYU61666.1 rhodanese-like domain-containing protein [Aliivibrio finisterrensis]RYU66495.1 rhodanese-like domain-containing protein [Aliivibrio finisterrensis]